MSNFYVLSGIYPPHVTANENGELIIDYHSIFIDSINNSDRYPYAISFFDLSVVNDAEQKKIDDAIDKLIKRPEFQAYVSTILSNDESLFDEHTIELFDELSNYLGDPPKKPVNNTLALREFFSRCATATFVEDANNASAAIKVLEEANNAALALKPPPKKPPGLLQKFRGVSTQNLLDISEPIDDTIDSGFGVQAIKLGSPATFTITSGSLKEIFDQTVKELNTEAKDKTNQYQYTLIQNGFTELYHLNGGLDPKKVNISATLIDDELTLTTANDADPETNIKAMEKIMKKLSAMEFIIRGEPSTPAEITELKALLKIDGIKIAKETVEFIREKNPEITIKDTQIYDSELKKGAAFKSRGSKVI